MSRFTSALLTAIAIVVSTNAAALSNSARVPVLLYHSGDVNNPCDYSSYASVALAADLETLHQRGITVVPLYWLAQWAVGDLDGSQLPDKVVAITSDDGNDLTWNDLYLPFYACGPWRTSFRAVIQNFKANHPELPWWSPHVTNFVIGSPAARLTQEVDPYTRTWTDSWWADAQASGFMEVYNHGTDHDLGSITSQTWDPDLGLYIPVGGYVNGVWQGENTFNRINDDTTSAMEVVNSANYIKSKIGVYPDLFAYPFGNNTPGLMSYFHNHPAEHQTYAAFTTTPQYVSRGQDRYAFGRFTWRGQWNTPSGFAAILDGATY